MQSLLHRTYPWIQEPLIISAPMKPFAQHKLALAVSATGGLGFIANCSKTQQTAEQLTFALKEMPANLRSTLGSSSVSLPIGLGYQIYQESVENEAELFKEFKPAAVWLFAARQIEDYQTWARRIRDVSPDTQIWIQVGTIAEALEVVKLCGRSIVLVMQGADSGGHGLKRSAGLVSLIPETVDALHGQGVTVVAAGGIAEGRGAAAALVLGAQGVVLGTRFLASKEAVIPEGFQQHLLQAKDGGARTMRSRLFDDLRGTSDFPANYDGRALFNMSVKDHLDGIQDAENKARYQEAFKNPQKIYGEEGRLVTYAGTGVGLVRKVQPAAEIVEEVRSGLQQALANAPISKL